MQFIAVLAKFDSPLWGFHVKVPEVVTAHFLKEKKKRVVCTLNGSTTFQAALMPNRNGYHFININKETRDKLKLRIGSEVQVELKKDESKYGLPLPEEMEVLLQQDPEGDQLFHALTPGKQRTLLYLIGKPKRSETRLKKAVVIIEHLKANLGKVDFRRLNEDMKAANRI